MAFDDRTQLISVKPVRSETDGGCTRKACFVVLTGSQAGKMFTLENDSADIGRDPTAAIVLNDQGVSRRHAQVHCADGRRVVLVDLGSTNGTYCNGAKISERCLEDGDRVQIGSATILKFSYQDALEEEFQRRQYESATRDGLTGCYNRKYIMDRMDSELAFARRHRISLALALVDGDHFKIVNDTYGHPAGDAVLKHLAGLMQAAIRRDDLLARYGGEEFILVLRQNVADDALIVMERIRRSVADTPLRFEGKEIRFTISAGVATVRDGDQRDAATLIGAADLLLYQAKERGRNRVEIER
jgi:diguanylate cyclase (GGDEF)-like protein